MVDSYRAAKRRKVSYDAANLSPSADEATSIDFEEFSDEEPVIGSDVGEDENDDNEDEENDEGEDLGAEDSNQAHDRPNGHSSGVNGAEDDAGTSRLKQKRNTVPRSRQLRDDFAGSAYAGEVYKSNVFKLQVDELLEQVRPQHKQNALPIERTLRTLKSIIEDIPTRESRPIHDAQKGLQKESKVVVPFPHPRPPKDANYKVEYAPPAHINIAGSYPLSTHTKTGEDLILDVVVTMPSEIFQEKDYLNHRYFYKRAYYLACLAAGIKKNEICPFRLSFDCLHGNSLLPILIAEPSRDDLAPKGSRIVILPAIPEGLFPPPKLLPSRNCIRPKTAEKDGDTTKPRPTPFYNASLRVDSLVSAYLKVQHNAANTCDAYRDACVLGRIWLRQHAFSGRIRSGGFGNFEWAVMIALLLQGGGPKDTPAFSPGYSSYQLFKATLQYIATRDLTKSPIFIGREKVELPKSDGIPVLFDIDRSLNILFKMTPWSYRLLQQEARASVAALSGSIFDQFDVTFIMRADFPLSRYDYILDIPTNLLVTRERHEDVYESLRNRAQQIFSTLSKGLMDRVYLVYVQLPEENSWSLDSETDRVDSNSIVRVGLIVDPVKANRTIDHGPSAEDKKDAVAFRRFWGDKAELRRFKDGSIVECLVWSNKNDPRSIIQQVVSYVLEKHIGGGVAREAKFIGDQCSRILGQRGTQIGIAPFQPLMTAFQTLERDIRGLDGLPLRIRHLLASSSQLSYSSIRAPLATGHILMTQPADVVLQFEGSARWPDDLTAIQRMKVAFLLKISELLIESIEDIHARVGLDSEAHPLQNQSFLDIVYPSGATFRVRIYHDRESTLLERRLALKTLTTLEKADTAIALAAYKRTFLKEPAHTQAMQALCTRYPMLSPSIRLAKKWFASHLLSPHFHPALIDLLVARTFTNPYPWDPPNSPNTALIRTLIFLSRWDWRNEPWIVDISPENAALKDADVAAMTTRFEAWRKIDPALNRVVLFVASNVDGEGNTWSDHAWPPKVVAGRMTALARAAVGEMKSKGAELDFRSLFGSGLEDYDFLVRLDRSVVQRKRGRKSSGFKNLEIQMDDEDVEGVGYDPVQLFIRDLQELYGDAMVLFYDEDGGDVVAGLWDPQTEKRGWKLKLGYSTMPVVSKHKDEGGESEKVVDVKINKVAILNEIARLGGKMVVKIDVKK